MLIKFLKVEIQCLYEIQSMPLTDIPVNSKGNYEQRNEESIFLDLVDVVKLINNGKMA